MITPIIVGRAAGARAPLAHIPGEDGWPVVGNTLKMLRDPVGRAEAMHRKYGPVHRDHLLGFPNVSLLGPEANEFVLLDREKNFSSAAGWAPILGRIFPRALMLMDFEEHRRHRKALVAAFKPGAMAAYLDAINAGVAARLAEWQQAKCFFYHLLRTTRISLAPGYAPRWQMWPIPKPRDGLVIRFERAA